MSECVNRSSDILQRNTSNDVESALDSIAEALTISPCSEKLLELKAEALFLVCSLFVRDESCFESNITNHFSSYVY